MPSRVWPLWLLTALLLAVFPVLNFVYWPLVLSSGALPPAGDSIAIPMYGSVVLTIIASPIVAGIAWLCLRRYNPEARLAAFRCDRPYRSAFATLILGGAAALLAAAMIADAITVESWYDYLWTLYFILWIAWLLELRAALIEQRNPPVA